EEDKAGSRLYSRNEEYGTFTVNSFSEAAASTAVPLPPTNRGYKLLQKLGWVVGQGLGKGRDGITAPIEVKSTDGGLGLGKQSEYDQQADEATRERRRLDVEIDMTDEMKAQRLEQAQKEAAAREDVREMHRGFYCELCDKQYKHVGEMSNHLSSYDHHHTKRLRDMREAEKARRGATVNRTKEQRREWEEMNRRMQASKAAHGRRNGGSSGGAAPTFAIAAAVGSTKDGARPCRGSCTNQVWLWDEE
ncbi:unnamed protein product, partial [Phaeothamnion confervicola]